MPRQLRAACVYADYEQLAEAAAKLLATPALLAETAESGFEAFTALDLYSILKNRIGVAVHAAGCPRTAPEILNIGSGKDFQEHALNIDINAKMNPDIVLDLACEIDESQSFATARFGNVSLRGGMFSKIIAHEVLEHIHDLKTFMNNILQLLKPGGCLDITVPYDLSLGAWQDPTHCRAFNENSWLYYTDWFWYMGWQDFRFDLVEQNFLPSDYGKSLLEKGMDLQEILRLPRAIDRLHAVLRKRETTAKEKQEYLFHSNGFYRKLG